MAELERTDDHGASENVGQLLGRCLRAAGATRVFGSSESGFTGIPGMKHLRVEDEALASLLADAQGRISVGRDAGGALLPGRRLRVSSRPGTVTAPLVIDDVSLLPEAIAGWGFGSAGGGSGLGAVELVLDIDFDAPVPPGLEPLRMQESGQLMTLSPSLAAFNMLVLAGPGVVRANQIAALQSFAEQAGVGVVNTWGAKGVFAWNSPHHYATAGLQARDFELAGFEDVQMVVAVGVDPAEAPPAAWAHAQVLDVEPWQLAALAYNWPDPEPVAPYPALYTELAAALGPLYESSASPLTPARAARDLSVVLPKGGLVTADPGPAGLWVARTFPTTEPGSVVVPSLPAPGFAVAAAMAASLDGRATIAVTTSPFDPTTEALLDLAASFGSSFVLAEWGADVTWAEASAHKVALRSALAAPGIAHVPVPVDFSHTRTLVDVAGEVVAWPSV
jgi:hypothetical protein